MKQFYIIALSIFVLQEVFPSESNYSLPERQAAREVAKYCDKFSETFSVRSIRYRCIASFLTKEYGSEDYQDSHFEAFDLEAVFAQVRGMYANWSPFIDRLQYRYLMLRIAQDRWQAGALLLAHQAEEEKNKFFRNVEEQQRYFYDQERFKQLQQSLGVDPIVLLSMPIDGMTEQERWDAITCLHTNRTTFWNVESRERVALEQRMKKERLRYVNDLECALQQERNNIKEELLLELVIPVEFAEVEIAEIDAFYNTVGQEITTLRSGMSAREIRQLENDTRWFAGRGLHVYLVPTARCDSDIATMGSLMFRGELFDSASHVQQVEAMCEALALGQLRVDSEDSYLRACLRDEEDVSLCFDDKEYRRKIRKSAVAREGNVQQSRCSLFQKLCNIYRAQVALRKATLLEREPMNQDLRVFNWRDSIPVAGLATSDRVAQRLDFDSGDDPPATIAKKKN